MNENLLREFIGEQHYDIRITKNGRWIDQKCTPDEISFVAECALALTAETGKNVFLSPDVWRSPYAVRKVQQFFGKPDPLGKAALDEYNKFFRQPLKMLSAAGVLRETGRVRNAIRFELAEPALLSFIARNDWNAYLFLSRYIEKTLRDSGLWDLFATFLDEQTGASFDALKDGFADFCARHTPISTRTEANRIFAKVLNPLSCMNHKLGTVGGRMSSSGITFSMLNYNRLNWRDADKPKDVPRGEFAHGPALPPSSSYFAEKAKDEVRKFNAEYNGGLSEVLGKNSGGEATQMHHIFPRRGFPDFAAFVENIIAITPTQHYAMAHPQNNTSKINREFQLSCLLSKNESIRKNILLGWGTPCFYSFNKFMILLAEGLSCDHFGGIQENDFRAVHESICSRFDRG